jgi:hypothetical protein
VIGLNKEWSVGLGRSEIVESIIYSLYIILGLYNVDPI